MLNNKGVHVTARLCARPETLDHLQRELTALTGPSRAEPGCLRYELFQQPEQPEQFLFIEQWRTPADLASHLQQPYMQAFIHKSNDLLAEPMQVALWQPVA